MRSMSETRKIWTYLARMERRTGARSSVAAPAAGMERLLGRSGGGVLGGLEGLTFLEDAGDHLIQRRVLHAHVDHDIVIQNIRQGAGNLAPLHLQLGHRS